METFQCTVCNQPHTKQIFVSHSRHDKPLLENVKQYLCQAQVSPFLYEIPKHLPDDPPSSWEIMSELRNSIAIMVVLGPQVSNRQWTQGWIGFELGAFIAFQAEPTPDPLSGGHKLASTFLIEDISQKDDAAIPYVDLALLLDFSDPDSWEVVQSIGELINPDVRLEKNVLTRANDLRLTKLIDKPVTCPDPECRSRYELIIWKASLALPPIFSIKCVVCRKPMVVTGSEDQSSSPEAWTLTDPPIRHISEVFASKGGEG